MNKNGRLATVVAAVLAALAWALPVSAQSSDELRLTVGKSIVLDFPHDIRQISTSDPAIVDAIAVTTREVLVHAKAGGFATLIIWSRDGNRSIYSVVIEQNLDQLRRLLKETFPNEAIQVQATRDSVSLTGKVSNKDVADRAVALVTPFGKTVVNNMQVAAAPVERQIVLKVRFAELDRNATRQFGVNLISTGAGNTFGRITTEQFNPPDIDKVSGGIPARTGGSAEFNVSDMLNIFAFRPDLNLGAFIRALQNEGVLQILAEPNLVTTNGREASFLVGGEFPIPVLQGGGNAGAVTIQFREFGIRLTFNPQITENGTIRMYVKPEVSTIDIARAITVSGFFIPALSTRRVETNVELREGQSFVIGGLIDDRVTESMGRIPGLASIPLLGHLFKSREERKERTELVVMVTPEITQPLDAPAPTPVMPREFMGPLKPEDMKQGKGSGAAREDKSHAAVPSPKG